MKMPRARAISPSASHEEIFAQRYRWLMGWALRMTSHDQQQAEDLVHDTFVQFMISQPDLSAITENIEGYLYSMLRNMHVSQVRRTARIRETAFPLSDILSISETASVQTELRMAGQRVQVQDELCRICQYSSIRKNSSKVGSAVILRFFHGYYPNEIAAVTRSSRAGVDKMLQRARTEARLYLKDPDSLSFLHGEQAPPDLQIRFGQEPEDLLCELRDALYRSRPGDCLTAAQLHEAYQAKETDRLSPQLLAHIVCCPVCLDEVNKFLGLPLLAEREPEKMTGRDKRDRDKGNGGSGDGSGMTGDLMEKPRRRLKQTLEHRPKELRVSVNGFILGSHKVNSETNQLSISAKGEEKIGFVEVFSEEEVRLLFCMVAPPPEGPVERKVVADLSDHRNLELALDFSDAWPSINVTYRDPTFVADEQIERVASSSESSRELSNSTLPEESVSGSRPSLKDRFRSWIAAKPTLRWNWLLRPSAVTAAFALLLIAVLILTQIHRPPALVITAESLLQQSAGLETAAAARTDQVVHRTIILEERKPSGEVVSRQRIEAWQGGARALVARRLYNDQGALVAGDWRRADGVQTLYHHGSRPQLQMPNPQSAIRSNDIWQLDLSAREFTSLVGDPQKLKVRDQGSNYLVSYERTEGAASAPELIKATLKLDKSELHAAELMLQVRSPKSEVREFHLVESRFERRPNDAVAPAVFEPETELLSSAKPEAPKLKPETAALSPISQPAAPVVATPALEVEVLNLLHQAGADLGEQITVTRTAEGELKVQGLVDTDKRKAELRAALSSVSKNPAVKIDISTVAEATAAAEKSAKRNPKSAPSEAITVERVEATKDSMPASAELRRYFGDEEQMRRFASRMINRSHEAMRHAGALKRLLNQFSPQDLRELDPEARAKWLALVRSHANAFQAETTALRQELQPVFFPSAPAGAAPESGAITNDAELARAVTRLFELGSANDERVRSAFSSSANGAAGSASINTQFAGLLKSAESLAAVIQKAH